MRRHQDSDNRSLELHRLIADKIRREPSLFEKPKQTLTHWRNVVCENSQPYMEEWQRLVDEGMDKCLAVATEDSEYARALRQSSPFCGVLSHKERFVFFKKWAEKGNHEAG